MTEPKTGSEVHFRELDGMRGVLATTVMLFHLGLNSIIASITSNTIINGQWALCVDFFFVLSGFVLCRSYIHRPTGLAEYTFKRLLRLAPLFYVATLLTVLITGTAKWDAGTILSNMLILQSFIGKESINFVSWTIPFEFILPGIGILLFSRLRLPSKTLLIGILLAAVTVQAVMTLLLVHGHDRQLMRAATGLSSGAILYLLRQRLGAKPVKFSVLISSGLFSGVVVVMALSGIAPMLALLFPPLVAGAIWFGAEAKGLFSTPALQALGRWSYSIYLIHIPVLLLIESIVGEEGVRGAPIKLSLIVVIIFISAITYRFIERPFINMGRRRSTV